MAERLCSPGAVAAVRLCSCVTGVSGMAETTECLCSFVKIARYFEAHSKICAGSDRHSAFPAMLSNSTADAEISCGLAFKMIHGSLG